jgi:hypothetical protein
MMMWPGTQFAFPANVKRLKFKLSPSSAESLAVTRQARHRRVDGNRSARMFQCGNRPQRDDPSEDTFD